MVYWSKWKNAAVIVMSNNEDFWDFYWETRLLPMENLGKQAAILAG
jgi:hypothetical protein